MADDIVKVKIDTDTKDSVKSVLKYTAVIGGSVIAVKKAVDMGKELINAYKVQEQAEKKLAGVVKATGGAAGLTTREMIEYAGSLQKVTTFGDEAIISAQAILATFKNVKDEAFIRTTEAALDMSTVLGTDLNSAMVQLGKAINDPVLGVTALNRAGIQFTDTQKETIKALQESGDLYAAQDIVLKEVEGQMGGTARAMVNGTGAFDQMGNVVGDLKEELGESVTYGLQPFAKWMTASTNAMIDFIQKAKIRDVTEDIARLQTRIDKLREGDIASQNTSSILGMKREDIQADENTIKKLVADMDALKDRRDKLSGGKVEEIIPPSLVDTQNMLNESQEKELTIWEKKAAMYQLNANASNEFYENEKAISDRGLELARQNTEEHIALIEMRGEALTTFFGGWSELTSLMGEDSKVMFAVSKGLAGAEAGVNSYLAFTKALAQGGIWGTVKASGILASGLAAQNKIFAQEPKKFATGGDFVTSGAQMIMVGDNATGRERVRIDPIGNDTGSNVTAVTIPVILNGREMGRAMTQMSADGQMITSSRSIR